MEMEGEYSKGRIVDIRRVQRNTGAIIQGAAAKKCRNGFGFTGGNGSYRAWDDVEYMLLLDVSVYANENHISSFDIRDEVLAANGRSRISQNLLDSLKKQLIGQKITLFQPNDGYWRWKIADWNELDLCIN